MEQVEGALLQAGLIDEIAQQGRCFPRPAGLVKPRHEAVEPSVLVIGVEETSEVPRNNPFAGYHGAQEFDEAHPGHEYDGGEECARDVLIEAEAVMVGYRL